MTALNVEEDSHHWQLVGTILITRSNTDNAHVEHEAGELKT
jgi:hypothetical protein